MDELEYRLDSVEDVVDVQKEFIVSTLSGFRKDLEQMKRDVQDMKVARRETHRSTETPSTSSPREKVPSTIEDLEEDTAELLRGYFQAGSQRDLLTPAQQAFFAYWVAKNLDPEDSKAGVPMGVVTKILTDGEKLKMWDGRFSPEGCKVPFTIYMREKLKLHLRKQRKVLLKRGMKRGIYLPSESETDE